MHRIILRSVLAIALLGVFGLVIVPRDWIHRCDQEYVDHHHPDGAAINGDLDCEICSVLVTTFDGQVWKPFVPVMKGRRFRCPQVLAAVAFRAAETPVSRGPPAS